jgi:hypothetical protein
MIKRTVSTEQIAQWCNADTGEIACAVEPGDIAGQGEAVKPFGWISEEAAQCKSGTLWSRRDEHYSVPVYLQPPPAQTCPGCAETQRMLVDAPAIEFPPIVEAVVSRDEPAPERTCGTCSIDDTVCDAVLVENRKLHAMVATLRRCAECGCCAKESCSSRDVNATATRSVQGWADPRALTEVPFRCAVVIGSPGCNHTFVPVTVTWIPTGEPK